MINVLEFTTNIGCKLKCSYCVQSLLIREYKKRSSITSLSMEMFKKYINSIPIDVEIRFGGFSEPWLNDQCTDMVLFAFDKGHKINVFTTLVGMVPLDIERLEKVNFLSFWVHLPSENGYERIDLTDTYLKTLKRLSRSRIFASYHYHGTNIHPAVKDYIKGKKLTNPEITPKCGYSKMEGIPIPVKKNGKISCPLDLRCNIILPNGDIVLCCMDCRLEYLLGNILVMDYYSLFKTNEFRRIEQGLIDSSPETLCRFCEFSTYDSIFIRILNKHIPTFMGRLLIIKSPKDLYLFLQKYYCEVNKHIKNDFLQFIT